MNKCVNIKLAEFKELVEQTGINPLVLSARMGVWMEQNNTNEWPTLEQLNLSNQVNYDLRLVNAITNLQRNKFESSKLQGWINDLSKQGVSKEQIDIFKSIVKDGMNKNDILTSLLANYSYTIEINTAKLKTLTFKGSLNDFNYEGHRYYIGEVDLDFQAKTYKDNVEIPQEDFFKIRDLWSETAQRYELTEDTQHYSNLTVPGGMNYTENRIVTPQIVPSIKGHPKFAENEDIGWFRSDEQVIGKKDFSKVIEDEDGGIGFEFDNNIVTKGNLTKTRRILEIQSDLFQKGRDRVVLTSIKNPNELPSSFESADDTMTIITTKENDKWYEEVVEYKNSKFEETIVSKRVITPEQALSNYKNIVEDHGNSKINTTDNQFLQLLNKDNNWVTFFIKSIIQDSAKKGYQKVLFPKGETAAKIEGHETIADEIKKINVTIDSVKNAKIASDAEIDNFILYAGYNPEQTGELIVSEEHRNRELKKLEERKSELKSQGIEKLKPIEAFYEIKIGNILEKQFGKDNVKTITDEFGNQWREIIIDQKRDLSFIKLQRIDKTLSPEVSKQIETIDKLYNILHKLYPEIDAKWQDIVWNPYNNEQVRGLSNTSAGYVLISNIYENEDTLPHEYAHIYIDWYKKAPIVQQGIKLYGDEEKLVQAIGENSVKALEWYNKFFQWLKSLFSKKQALLGDLTKSFLSGTALLPERESGSDELKMASMDVSTKENPIILPLNKNTEKIYKNFNLLNKNNQVKVFKTQEEYNKAKEWVKFNNENTKDYSFVLRKTQDGYRIFVAEKFDQLQTNLHFQKINSSQMYDSVSKFLLNHGYDGIYDYIFNGSSNPTNSRIILNNLNKYIDNDSELYTLIKRLTNISLNVVFDDKFPDDMNNTYMYISNADTIHLNLNNIYHDDTKQFIHGFLHEVIHGYTINEYFNNSKFKKDIDNLFFIAKEQSKNKFLYGYTNPLEFISEIYTNPEFISEIKSQNISIFQKILNYIYRIIFKEDTYSVGTNIYNKTINAINTIISNVNDNNFNNQLDDYIDSFSNYGLKLQQIDDKQLANLQNTTNKILERMRNRASYLEYRGYKTASEKMLNKVKDLSNLDDAIITVEYIKFAADQLSKLSKTYDDLLKKEKDGVANVWNLRQLAYWKNTAESFDLLDEVKQLFDNEPGLFGKLEDVNDIIKLLNNTKEIRDKLEYGYMYHGRPIWNKWLSQFSTFIDSSYRQQAELEYKKQLKSKYGSDVKGLKTALKNKVEMETYIQNYINENKDKIDLEKQAFINTQSKATDSSINAIWRYAGTVATSMDSVVGSTATAYYTHMIEGQQDYQNKYKDLLSHIRAVEKQFGPNYFTSQKEMYDFMIDTVDDTARIVSEIPYSFTKAYNDFRDSISNKTTEERKTLTSAWLGKNAKIKDYDKLSKDIIDFIKSNELGLDESIIKTLIGNQKSKYNRKSPYELSQIGLITEEQADFLSKNISTIVWQNREIDSKRYKNDKYEAIQRMSNDDPRKQLYEFITDLTKKGDAMVPESFKLNGRLPGIDKSTSERIKSGENLFKVATKGLRDTFSKRPDDTLFGAEIGTESNKAIDILPVYFTNSLPENEQSFDLGTIFKEWYKHNVRYFYTNQIMAELEFSKAVINNRTYYKKLSNGKKIENTLSKMFSKKNPDLEISPSFIKDESSKIASQFNDWFNQVVLEKSHKDFGTINIFGAEISLTKAIDTMTKYTSLRIMGLNWASLVNNIAMAEAQQTIESFAYRYISPKSYIKAASVYGKDLPNILGDVGSDKYSSFINQLNEYFGVFNEGDEHSLRFRNKLGRLFNTSTLYFTTNIGEHMVQSKFLLGMLIEKRALDKNGKDIGSMLDYYKLDEKTNRLIFDPESKVSNFSKQDQLMFSTRFRALSIEMHGNYSEYTKVAMQANGLSNLALMFRKWIIPTMNKRWSKKGYNEFLQDFEEGYYRTGGKFVGNKVKQFFLRWSDEIKAVEIATATDWNTMSDFEKSNINRFATDCTITLSAIILYAALANIKNEWPKGEKNSNYYIFWSNMAYQMYRFQTDQMFYIWPGSFSQLIQSPIPSMSTFNSFTKFMQDCTHPFDVYKTGRWKGEYKLKKDIYNLVPAVRQLGKLMDPDAQLNALQNPLY